MKPDVSPTFTKGEDYCGDEECGYNYELTKAKERIAELESQLLSAQQHADFLRNLYQSTEDALGRELLSALEKIRELEKRQAG